MNKILVGILCIWSALFADWDQLFVSKDDPTLVENVNVITGNLNLGFQDITIDGAVPFSFSRTYSSSGAIPSEFSQKLKKLRQGVEFDGGWSFLPHLHLLVYPGELHRLYAYLAEPSGAVIAYEYCINKAGDYRLLEPLVSSGQSFGQLSGRKNPANHKLYLNIKEGIAKLYLADGGVRIYQGKKDSTYNIREELNLLKGMRYYKLIEEVLPSGHKILYEYSEEEGEKEICIRICNPTREKVYGWMKLRKSDSQMTVCTSESKHLELSAIKLGKERYVFSSVNSTRPPETIRYVKTRENLGLSLESLFIGGREVLQVEYYPLNKKKKWSFKTDKVSAIRSQNEVVATFVYEPHLTCVRDAHNILTRYHHDGVKLMLIEYCDPSDLVIMSEKFVWENGLLISKEMHDGEGRAVFSKSFVYDDYKNVIQETLCGNLTGNGEGEESYSKWYTYDEKRHLLVEEREEDGPTYRYAYLPGSDLITRKSTVCEGEVIYEESFRYDTDRLLVEKKGPYKTEKYKRDPKTGMIVEIECGRESHLYTYNKANQVIRDETPFYSIDMEYDEAGRMVSKSTPLGLQNEYKYDLLGNLIEVKEVSFPRKRITYDRKNRPIGCEANGKRSESVYDRKGRVISEMNSKGGRSSCQYDSFGRCIRRELPSVLDERGEEYHPVTEYEYDIQGNCVLERMPTGGVKKSFYTAFKKPFHVIHADGSEIRHRYYKNGELKETLYPDGIKMSYEYDELHRLIATRDEHFEYEGLLLKRHYDAKGLCTTYTYDDEGRKIGEKCEGRRKEFVYDEFGYVGKVVQGETVTLQVHDVEGRVIEESENGFNRTVYAYDDEGRSTAVTKGFAIDRMAYDEEGRVISHIDPLQNRTEIFYDTFSRTIEDPLGNLSIEKFDSLGRVIKKERKRKEGETQFLEQFFYDRGGNVGRRLTHVYQGNELQKTIEAEFKFDLMGRKVKEIEGKKRETIYSYDVKGRLISKISPNGVSIDYTYDDLDRMIKMKSSDGSIDYEYVYDLHSNLIQIKDLILNFSLDRSYTKFGELACENNLSWAYDNQGRVRKFTLPDGSGIGYEYGNGCMESVSRVSKEGEVLYSHRYTKFDSNRHVEEEVMVDGSIMRSKRDLLERPIEMVSPHHKQEIAFGPTGLLIKNLDKEYSYDDLSQLIKEGEKEYQFDSLGNPSNCEIDDLNQIVSPEFIYDENGNLIQHGMREYTYDALGRLTSVTCPGVKKIFYTYDPLSRLLFKEDGSKKHYLYDREFEIGTMDENGIIQELKVLGLGVKGDIGAAIAIEIDGKRHLPLHDLQGNVIGLEGVETYDITAFGEEDRSDYINPWRFSSKRNMDGLIFFGRRFYDPHLKRWLTPDPLGFQDSRNLYLYTLNSPLNRLDLFGLEWEVRFGLSGDGQVSGGFRGSNSGYLNVLPAARGDYLMPARLLGKGTNNGVPVDVMVICTRVYDFNFTPDEYKKGEFNLFDHLHELFSGVDGKINVVTFGMGINTNYNSWLIAGNFLAAILPRGTTLMSIHNPSNGLPFDLLRVAKEKHGCETKSIAALRDLHTTLLDNLPENGKGLHFGYSEGGLIYNRSFEGMSGKDQKRMQQHFYYEGIGPAEAAPVDYGIHATNTFSDGDYLTGRHKHDGDKNYDIRWIAAQSPASERTLYFIDHPLLATTYRNGTGSIVNNYNEKVGFYVGNHR